MRRKSEGAVVFEFDKVHYEYWVGHSLPIVLALYHPDTQKIIWCHLTIDTCIKTGIGRKVLIPLTQELTTSRMSYFSSLARRLTPQEFVLEEQRRLELIDPRFRAIMTVTAASAHTEFRPKDSFSLQFTFSGDEESISPKITDLIERGKPTIFEKNEFTLIGTPLYDHIMRDANKVLIQMGVTADVTTSLRYCRHSNSRPKMALIEAIPSTITAGRSRLTLELCNPKFPLEFSVEMARDFSGQHFTCRFGFLIEKWYGHPLLALPYFEQIDHFTKCALKEGQLEFECLHDGNHLFSGKSTETFPKVHKLADFLGLLAKARFVAKQLKRNPIFRELSDQDFKDIEVLYALLKYGEYSTRVNGFQMSATIAPNPELLKTPPFNDLKKPSPLLLNFTNFDSIQFLGEKVELGPFQFVATNVVVTNWAEVHEALTAPIQPDGITVQFASKGYSKLTRRLPGKH